MAQNSVKKYPLEFLHLPKKLNMLKITIQDNEYSFSFDSSCRDVIEGGVVKENDPTVTEALDACIALLACIYGNDEVQSAIRVL